MVATPARRHPLGHGPAHHVAGGQLVDEPLAVGVAEQRPVAAQRLGQQRPGHGRMVQRGRMELEELDVGHRHAGPQGHGDAVAGGLGRVGGHGEELAGAAGGQHDVAGPHLDRPARRGRGPRTPRQRPPSTSEVEGEPLLEDGRGRCPGGRHQRPLDLGAGGRPPGVQDPGRGVAPLAGQGQRPARLPVEHGAQRDQLVHPGRALVDQHADGVGVAQPGPGGQRVGQVEVGRVLVAAEDGGHAALGPAGGRLRQLAPWSGPRPGGRPAPASRTRGQSPATPLPRRSTSSGRASPVARRRARVEPVTPGITALSMIELGVERAEVSSITPVGRVDVDDRWARTARARPPRSRRR